MERDKLEDEHNSSDIIEPLSSPSPVLRTPSPLREREKLVIIPKVKPSQAIKGNIFLAPWGEDARRAGEGLFLTPLLYEKINLNPNDNYES